MLIEEVLRTYDKKCYAACICTIFPLLDALARRVFRTTNLVKDIKEICKKFEQLGFGKEKLVLLTSHAHGLRVFREMFDGKQTFEEVTLKMEEGFRHQLGIIGPALSSFLHFSHEFYGFYKEDVAHVDILNRHAILHGAVNQFGNKENAIKILTFFYLMLELEPVLAMLFDEPVP